MLEKQHGRPERPGPGSDAGRTCLDQLILGVLSDETSERKAAQALRRLREEFVDLNELRVARPHDCARVIQMVAQPEAKAGTITGVLQQLFTRYGALDLDLNFLKDLPLNQARAFLEQLEGVDARTAASVILFSLGGNTIPADASVVRVTKRTGLVNRTWSTEQVQQALERMIPAADRFSFYALMVIHGEKICLVKTTRCEACALVRICETGRERMKPAASAKKSGKGKAASRKTTRRAKPRSKSGRARR